MIASLVALLSSKTVLAGVAAVLGFFGLQAVSARARQVGRREAEAKQLEARQAARQKADTIDQAVAADKPAAKRDELGRW